MSVLDNGTFDIIEKDVIETMELYGWDTCWIEAKILFFRRDVEIFANIYELTTNWLLIQMLTHYMDKGLEKYSHELMWNIIKQKKEVLSYD
ncbi:MAG: hypothetical protein COA52_00450 [Hyphomicrobiales bacterium]|nr:MAG: hypothetical protein COA52_00450 [Hyphomicrobiales bacterium]